MGKTPAKSKAKSTSAKGSKSPIASETTNLSLYREDQNNVSVATDEEIARLAGKLRRNPRGLAAMRIAYVTDDPPGARTVNTGNKRLRVLKQIAADGGLAVDGTWLVSPAGEVPAEWFCDITFMTPEQRKEFRLNTNISDGSFDAEKLLAQYTRDDLAALMSADAIDELCKQAEKDDPKNSKTDADAVPTAPETPVSKRGEVYICGEHRLMCGDATSAEDVARLMGDERADIAFTSPPYNLMRTDILQALNSDRVHVSYDIRKGTYIHTRDDLSDEEYAALLIDSCRLCLAYCDEVFYNIGILSGSKQGFVRLLYEFRERLVDLICWKKNNFLPLGLPAQKKMLGHPCEFVVAFGSGKRSFSHAQWKLGAMTNCIETTTAAGNRFSKIHHGTMPVDFAEKMLLNFSAASVLDVFGGTGTTMIAAQQTGRVARLMEIDPQYCDVIRKRWAEFVHGEGCDWQALTPKTK